MGRAPAHIQTRHCQIIDGIPLKADDRVIGVLILVHEAGLDQVFDQKMSNR